MTGHAAAAACAGQLPEIAPVIAMIRLLDRPAAAEIEHALSLRLNPPATAAERRWAQLGALATLMNALPPEADGRVPHLVREAYERHRAAQTPEALDHRTLVSLYGSWLKACRAAHGLLPDGRYLGTGQPWPSPLLSRRRVPAYSLEEVHKAIERSALELGRVPSSRDYQQWSIEKKRRARQTGAKVRIPDIKVLYRLYPEGANRWLLAVAAARLNEVAIALARAKKLLGAAGVPERPDEPLARLRQVSDGELARAGFDAEGRAQLNAEGFGWLQLSQGIRIARLLEGSIDWMVGRSLDVGQPPEPTAAFDTDRLTSRLGESKVTPKTLREELDLPVGPYRDLVTGKREPSIAELVVIATVIGCPLAELLKATG